jgi:hypothetical protein
MRFSQLLPMLPKIAKPKMTEADSNRLAPAAGQVGPAAGDRGCRHPQPVFILAPPRSFSTVTLAVLAGHPDCYGFPEMLLFSVPLSDPRVANLLNESGHRPRMPQRWILSRQSGIMRAIAEVHESSQSADALLRAREWLVGHSAWSTVQLMNYLLDLVSPRIGIEKSPDTVGTDDRLDACLDAYPHARYLHLTRHPVSSQRSMHAHWRRLPGPTLIAEAASWWYLGHCRVIRTLARLPDSQWMRLRAEDLLREPRVHLPRVLAWLGLPSDDHIVARMVHTQDWPFAGTGPAGDLFGGDPLFMRSPELRPVAEPGPVLFDPSWGLPAQMQARMKTLARYLGY